ncbi:MAG TPA: hypothetical protein VEK79_07415 [Thermoanaerobaculia bacterium]|nr:hypothetical protein [Thermoanaerobaculia bacterium]
MKLLLLLALLNVAKQPGTPITIESFGFESRVVLPQGWSFTADRGFIPPPALVSSCRVRGQFYTDRNWDRFLTSVLRSDDRYRTADDARRVHKIGDHPAVTNRYTRDVFTVRDIYINLADLQPDSGAVFTFEGSNTPAGSDCELQFVAMIHSARITQRQ